jgi:hypothetical protein
MKKAEEKRGLQVRNYGIDKKGFIIIENKYTATAISPKCTNSYYYTPQLLFFQIGYFGFPFDYV